MSVRPSEWRRGACLLLAVILGAVLHKDLEEVGGKVLVERLGELVDGRGHLETLLKDPALALDAHILGPLDVAVKGSAGRKSLADACKRERGDAAILVVNVLLKCE